MKHFDGGHQFTGGVSVNLLIVLGIFIAILLRIDSIIAVIGRWM